MRRTLRWIWPVLFLLIAPHAQAQIFMCKDAAGRTITSDRYIPECVGRALREYDRKGVPRREILPPPTAEQKRQSQLQVEKRRAEQAAAIEQQRADQAIRIRYRSEAEIEAARRRALETVQHRSSRDADLLADTEKQHQAARVDAAAHEKKNMPIPGELQHKLYQLDQTAGALKKIMHEREAEIARINARYDETISRFRRMNAVAAAR